MYCQLKVRAVGSHPMTNTLMCLNILTGNSSPWSGGSMFVILLSEWSFTDAI